MIFFRVILESVIFAFSSLIRNKLRTFLSLLGITVGIFCIITISAAIDSLKQSIISSLDALGGDIVFVQKYPWEFSSNEEYSWWKYINRPKPSLVEFKKIEKLSKIAENVAFVAGTYSKVVYKDKNIDNSLIYSVSYKYNLVQNFVIEKGRYFSPIESDYGINVAIIGYSIALNLFGIENPIEKEIKINGRKFKVIAVLEKVGDSNFGMDSDYSVFIPLNIGKTIYNLNNCNPTIYVSKKENYTMDNLTEELIVILRGLRRLSPFDENNFALNRASMIAKSMESLFSVLNIVGFIIGGFAIVVGGFGIANIMFVSVKERTKQIGIQKAIGAKSYIILIQFLTESVILCLFGGILGLILVGILVKVASLFIPFEFILSFKNIIIGISLSIVIGIISGYAPARKAAKLNPINAINAL